MPTVDELVTILKYQMDDESRQALEASADGPDRAKRATDALGQAQGRAEQQGRVFEGTTDRVNRTFGLTDKAVGMAGRTIGAATDFLKNFGAVGMVTSGIMAAWNVNATNQAASLTSMAHSTQLSTRELQAMGSMYDRLGSNMQTFANDANKFQQITGQSLDLDHMIELADRLSAMSDREALAAGRAFGLSDDTIRILRENRDGLREAYAEAEKLGHINNEGQIESLNRMGAAWSDLSGTIKGNSIDFQAGMAGEMTEGVNKLTEALSKNKEAYKASGEVIGSWARNVMSVYAGLISGESPVTAFYNAAKLSDQQSKDNAKKTLDKGEGEIWTQQYAENLEKKGYTKQDARITAELKNRQRQLFVMNPDDEKARKDFHNSDDEELRPQKLPTDPHLRKQRIRQLKEAGFEDSEIADFATGKKVLNSKTFTERSAQTQNTISPEIPSEIVPEDVKQPQQNNKERRGERESQPPLVRKGLFSADDTVAYVEREADLKATLHRDSRREVEPVASSVQNTTNNAGDSVSNQNHSTVVNQNNQMTFNVGSGDQSEVERFAEMFLEQTRVNIMGTGYQGLGGN